MGCATTPEPKPVVAAPRHVVVPTPRCTESGRPTSIVVETSLLKRGQVDPVRRRLEWVLDATQCTGVGCRTLDEAAFDEAWTTARPLLAVDQVEARNSPHMPTDRLQVNWGPSSCTRVMGRRLSVVDADGFRERLRALQAR